VVQRVSKSTDVEEMQKYRFDEPSTPIIKTSAFQKNLV